MTLGCIGQMDGTLAHKNVPLAVQGFKTALEDMLAQLTGFSPDEQVERILRLLEESDAGLLRCLGAVAEGRSYGIEGMAAKLVRRRLFPVLLRRKGTAWVLDSLRVRRAIDRSGMTDRISDAYIRSIELSLGEEVEAYCLQTGPIHRIVVAGMGGSAIGPLVAIELLRNMGYSIPVEVHRHYPLSHLHMDSKTLVIISSFSGNTEESLFTYEEAVRKGAPIICISKDGLVEECASAEGHPFVRLLTEDLEQPREAIALFVMVFLKLFSKLRGAWPHQGSFDITRHFDLRRMREMTQQLGEQWSPQVPFERNLAKQMALYFLYGSKDGRARAIDYASPKTPVVMVDQSNASCGIRIENQFGECVESPIRVLTFYEDAHNKIEATVTSAMETEAYTYIALRSADEHDRAKIRFDKTIEELFEKNGVRVHVLETEGDTPLERKFYLLELLDYIRAYASLLRGTDPLPVMAMDRMKDIMHKTLTKEDEDLLVFLYEREAYEHQPKLTHSQYADDPYVVQHYPLPKIPLYRLEKAGMVCLDHRLIRLTKEGRNSASRHSDLDA